MSSLPALHGKTLPLVFTRGYLDGLWNATGSGPFTAAYQFAAQELVPDTPPRQQWLAPLLAYFHLVSHDPQPLDYRFVALFQQGFHLNGPAFMNVAQVFTRRAGNEWWFGEAPISTYQNQTSLQQQYASRIWGALAPHKFGAPGVTIHNVKSHCELGILGVMTFLQHFQRESEIDFTIETTSDTIEIEINDCPFCLHEHNLCYVFTGIVAGMLDWLHGHWGRENNRYRYLTLNERTSTNHRVVIDIHLNGLDTNLSRAAS